MESGKKFARSTNFTAREENILLSLVKKYKDQIECKKTDTNTNKIKYKAWIELTKEYNSICAEYHRDVKVLKNKYENIKKRTKQKFADQKKYVKGTGGGPEKDIIVTTTDNNIHDIIGTQLTGLSSEFDDDAVAETIHICTAESIQLDARNMDTDCDLVMPTATDNQEEVRTDEGQKDVSASVNISYPMEDRENWAKYTPSMLRTPKAKSLRSSQSKENKHPIRAANKSTLGNKLEEWATSKTGLVEIQRQCLLEAHKLKLAYMKECHEQQLRLQAKEAEDKRAYLKREHEAKMELIEIEKKLLLKKL